jgi:hypothetical protein
MAEFPGAVDGFVLLQMESDGRQNSKMRARLEDQLLCPVAVSGEPIFIIVGSCMN